MAIENGYMTLEQYKSELEIEDFQDDAKIERVIEAASRAIDVITWRRFFTTAEDESRYYTAVDANRIYTDDIISITTLKTDEDGDRTYERTWAITDYDLMPYNASLNGEPYTWIETAPNGSYAFPTNRKGIQIAGKFGWSSTAPAQIYQACMMASQRLLKRKDTPLGVSANLAAGQFVVVVTQLKADPDFMNLIEPFIRRS